MAMLPSPDRARTAVSLPDTLTRPSPVVASTAPSTPSSSMPPSPVDAETLPELLLAWMRPSPERSAIVPFTRETRMAPSPLEARTFAASGTETTRRALPEPNQSQLCASRAFHLDGHAITVLAALNLDGRRSRRAGRVFFDRRPSLPADPTTESRWSRRRWPGRLRGCLRTVNRFSSRWVTHPESAPATIQPASGTHSDRPGSRKSATGNHGLILRELRRNPGGVCFPPACPARPYLTHPTHPPCLRRRPSSRCAGAASGPPRAGGRTRRGGRGAGSRVRPAP